MRVMVFMMATEDHDMNAPPTPEMLAAFEAMDVFTEELVQAGVMVAGAGLKPGAESKRVTFDGASRTVTDGPFAEAREMVAGFYIWEVKDLDEAVAWVKRAPNPNPGQSNVEIRPFYEPEDLGQDLSPEELAVQRDGERGRLGVA